MASISKSDETVTEVAVSEISRGALPTFTPADWYWRGSPGLYSSARHAIVQNDDASFAAWKERTGLTDAQIWPVDEAGEQTQDALRITLDALGVGVPDVTSAQAKIMLSRAKYLDAAKTAISTLDEEVEIWFTDARTWQRNNPHVAEVGAALGLTSDQIDDLFRQAAQIQA